MPASPKGKKFAVLAGGSVLALSALGLVLCREELEAWYRFRQEFQRLSDNPQGYPEYLHVKTGIVFVRLPGGTFTMGSPEGEVGARKHERPLHQVTLGSFLIARYEVSRTEWARVMQRTLVRGDQRPMNNINWYQCQEFCKRTGLRLPTEAQWEYACRASTTGPYAGSGRLREMGWYWENSGYAPHPVDSLLPNQSGLFQMHGNLSEWCRDTYDGRFYSKPAATGKDPVCTAGSENRVVRGGGWRSPAVSCRSANRQRHDPSRGSTDLGFRPVLPLR